MPSYVGTPPMALKPDESFVVWNAETPAAGSGGASASQAVALQRVSGEVGTPFAVALKFAGDPGAFQVDVQAAEENVDSKFQVIAGLQMNVVDATMFTCRADAILVNTRFVRLLMRTRTNAVAVTALIKR